MTCLEDNPGETHRAEPITTDNAILSCPALSPGLAVTPESFFNCCLSFAPYPLLRHLLLPPVQAPLIGTTAYPKSEYSITDEAWHQPRVLELDHNKVEH